MGWHLRSGGQALARSGCSRDARFGVVACLVCERVRGCGRTVRGPILGKDRRSLQWRASDDCADRRMGRVVRLHLHTASSGSVARGALGQFLEHSPARGECPDRAPRVGGYRCRRQYRCEHRARSAACAAADQCHARCHSSSPVGGRAGPRCGRRTVEHRVGHRHAGRLDSHYSPVSHLVGHGIPSPDSSWGCGVVRCGSAEKPL